MDRRRGSPPPPPPRRGRGPYDGPPMDRRRSRSPSDRFARGRSPPPFKRRRDDDAYYGRFERGDDYMGRGPPRGGPPGPPRGGYPDPYYEGRRGSPDRHDGPHDKPPGPLTFKQFIQKQKDDPSPEEAQERYKQYLVEYHGGEIKAEFESTKDKQRVRDLYDPRSFEKALAKRNEEATASRTQFLSDLDTGVLQLTSPGFNQGAGDLAPKAPPAGEGEAGKDEPPVAFAPPFCWRPSRVAADLSMARRLTRRLDHEKGFPDDHPLLPVKTEEAAAAQAEADAQDAQDAAALKEEGKAAPSGSAKRYVEVQEEVPQVDEHNYNEMVGKLDLLLTYLWKVHGVDYYSGYELTASEFSQRLTACRLLRGPKPEGVETSTAGAADAAAGEPGAADMAVDGQEKTENGEGVVKTGEGEKGTEQSKEEDANAEGVEVCWNKRIMDGDPLEAQCQRKKVEERLDAWIDKQIICHADTKWGSHVSPKMFMARKFVVKHIRTKHEDKVQAEKEKILDELYFEAFKAAKLEEEERIRQEEEAAAAHKGHEDGGEDGAMDEDDPEGRREGKGGRGGRGAGRGGRGARMGMMPGMMMDPMALMHMPPMMMAGGALPFMPMLPHGMLPLMPPAMLMGAMRGGGRGGRMSGGRGGRGGRGMREYYDLDNPQNNRAILDYGDL